MQKDKGLVLFVLIANYADWEASILSAALRNGFGMWNKTYHIGVVAPTKDPVDSIGGFRVIPDYTFKTAPDDFDALILVGGTSWLSEEAKGTLSLIKKAILKQAVLGAICDASTFLAINGFLNQINHTSNELAPLKSISSSLYAGEAKYQYSPSVRDGKIVTANGVGFIEFTRDILSALDVAPEAVIKHFFKTFKSGSFVSAEARL